MIALSEVPYDFPVKALDMVEAARDLYDPATGQRVLVHSDVVQCGACGAKWDDSIPTEWTPAPAGRCPFEYFHKDSDYKAADAREARDINYGGPRYWAYLDEAAQEHYAYFMEKGDIETAEEMFTRSLAEALRGNDGD